MTTKQTNVLNKLTSLANPTLLALCAVLLMRILHQFDKLGEDFQTFKIEYQQIKFQTGQNQREIHDLTEQFAKFRASRRDHTYEGKEGIF